MRRMLAKIPYLEIATSLFELAGLALLVAFAYTVWAPAALAVAGVVLLLLSWRLSGAPMPRRRRRRDPASEVQ